MTSEVALRDVIEADVATFFAHVADPASRRMAAFVSGDPNDRAAFDAKWRGLLADPTVVARTILCDGEVVGHVARFELEGEPQVTYWIDRRHWARGLATRALRLFLEVVTERPLFASAAADNTGSLRVLQKCGFAVTGSVRAFARARGAEIEEVLLCLR